MFSRFVSTSALLLSLFSLAACAADTVDAGDSAGDPQPTSEPMIVPNATTNPTKEEEIAKEEETKREVEEREEDRDTTPVEVYPSACGSNELLWHADRQCGKASKETRCLARPTECSNAWNPVCGCDGKTYGNTCKAWKYGIDVAAQGGCL